MKWYLLYEWQFSANKGFGIIKVYIEALVVLALDQQEVIETLDTLIPKTYGTGFEDLPKIYTKWNVVTAKPFPKTVGVKEEEDYFGMANYFCGKEIAQKSWLVRLDFPKAPGANLAQGQIFLAKSKTKGWFVWFRYH